MIDIDDKDVFMPESMKVSHAAMWIEETYPEDDFSHDHHQYHNHCHHAETAVLDLAALYESVATFSCCDADDDGRQVELVHPYREDFEVAFEGLAVSEESPLRGKEIWVYSSVVGECPNNDEVINDDDNAAPSLLITIEQNRHNEESSVSSSTLSDDTTFEDVDGNDESMYFEDEIPPSDYDAYAGQAPTNETPFIRSTESTAQMDGTRYPINGIYTPSYEDDTVLHGTSKPTLSKRLEYEQQIRAVWAT